MTWNGKHYWLIGASSGLGEELARQLSDKGARLSLSARNHEALEALALELPSPAFVAPCDITQKKSVKLAFDSVTQQGDLDGIIFCAGQYAPMTAANWDAEKAEQICEVNFNGCARVLGQYLPYMIPKDIGHIALIGSLSGFKGIPGGAAYAASKAGMMHLAEGLHADLDPKKFKVQLINPGFIRTRLTDQNTFKMPFIMSPDQAAQRTIKAMESKRFQTNFPKRFSIMFSVFGTLPNFLYFSLARALLK